MGEVVDMKGGGDAPRRRTRPSPTTRDGRPRPSKTALVLGGGGLTGVVYEIGALRALDLLAVNSTTNDFNVYVGTSAGSFVAALAANGVTPDEMMRVVHQRDEHDEYARGAPFEDIELAQVLRPNLGEFARRGLGLPLRAVSVAREFISHHQHMSIMDLAIGLGEGLPSGVYSGAGVEAYLRRVLIEGGRHDSFDKLRRELYITATDLDTCERIVFGDDEWHDVPISLAVRASTALPMVYKPVQVRDRELVDGGLVSTTNLDIAVKAGAKLIVVVNPLVPFHNPFNRSVSTLLSSRPRRVSDMGLTHVGYQAFKMMAHQRLHIQASYWRERFPGVDIVLIEPETDDELMFETSMMNFTRRLDIARHGFGSVTHALADNYEHYEEVFNRHGIEISAERVREVVGEASTSGELRERAWQRILEEERSEIVR